MGGVHNARAMETFPMTIAFTNPPDFFPAIQVGLPRKDLH
jgi:hypothetical protein